MWKLLQNTSVPFWNKTCPSMTNESPVTGSTTSPTSQSVEFATPTNKLHKKNWNPDRETRSETRRCAPQWLLGRHAHARRFLFGHVAGGRPGGWRRMRTRHVCKVMRTAEDGNHGRKIKTLMICRRTGTARGRQGACATSCFRQQVGGSSVWEVWMLIW